MNPRALAAEGLGTFALVAATCGAALLAAPAGGGAATVSLGAGLAVLMMAYAVGHISGGHFNPAVTLGLVAAGRFDFAKAPGYIGAQLAGGLLAALVVSVVLDGVAAGGRTTATAFAAISNAYGGKSGITLRSAFLIEFTGAALLLVAIVGSTARGAAAGFAPLAIGAAYAGLLLLAVPITNGSLNPARSTATAAFAGGDPIAMLWLFWVAPILGAVIGGAIARWLQSE